MAGSVPFRHRREREREWEAELWMLEERGVGAGRLASFVWGVITDALAERRDEEGMMGGWIDEIGNAARRVRRSPGFALVTVAILAVGVGANTALFTALEAALLDAPPYPEADRIVMVDLLYASSPTQAPDTMGWSYPKFAEARDRFRSVAPLAGYSPTTLTLTGAGDPARMGAEYVSAEYFGLLGIVPALGRGIGPDEAPPAAGLRTVLSHGLWSTRFGSDPGAVGRTVSLNGSAFEIIGVAPEGFSGLTGGAELWVPIASATTLREPRRLERAWAHWLLGVGRLSAGATLADARAEAGAIGEALSEIYPDPDAAGGAHGAAVVGLTEARINPVARAAVGAVSAAGVVLLLIACANVGGLFVVRANRRRHDTAVRAAIGAGRGRLVREHMTESLLLAVVGGALGLVLAAAIAGVVPASVSYALETSGTRSLAYLDPSGMAVDGSAILWGTAIALAAGLAFGLLPARNATRVDLARDLRASPVAATGGAGVRGVLVAAQLALTIVLLAGAGLMARSFQSLRDVGLGFEQRDVLTASFDLGPGRSVDELRSFEERALAAIRALPSVLSVGASTCGPLEGRCEITGVRRIDDEPEAAEGEARGVLTYTVSDDYFRTVGAAPLSGRAFDPSDAPGSSPAVVINTTAALDLFGEEAPIGRRISITHSLTADRMATVVGVVPDIRYGSLEESVLPAVYLSARQAPRGYGALLVRTEGDPMAVLPAVRTAVANVDPALPLTATTTLAERVSMATARTRVILWLLSAFAASGLLLSALGLYALVSYAVAGRTREVGVRMALGAERPSIIRLISLRPILLVVSGAIAGVVLARSATGALSGLLFEVSPGEPLVLAGATALLLVIGTLAAVGPVRRATRIDPTEALRNE